MRRLLVLFIPITLASCNQENLDAPVDPRAADVSESVGGPTLSTPAAPGVAFQYRYAFDLPSASIAAVQEEHAAACEKLGLARCRITGLRYRQVDEQHIDAMLSFLLDPNVARQFGKTGTDVVSKADGKLVDSEITSHDAGALIKSAGRTIAQLTDDLRRIEERLAQKNLTNGERERLQSQAAQLRQSIQAQRASRDEQEETLATTPMTFEYGVLEGGPALGDAVTEARESFVGSVTWLLIALITLSPWLVLGGLGWAGYRFARPLLLPRRQDAVFAPEAS